MKKLLMFGLAVHLTWCAHAQGFFSFTNRGPSASGFDQPVYDWDGITKLAGLDMVAGIFLNGQAVGPVAPFQTGLGAGYWNPGADLVRELAGRSAGETVNGLVVHVWDGSKGATLPASRSAGGRYGESAPFRVTLGTAESPGIMDNFKSFHVAVPEPSTLALGALGAAALALCRRLAARCANRPQAPSPKPAERH